MRHRVVARRTAFARIDEYEAVHKAPTVLHIVQPDAPKFRGRFNDVEVAFVLRKADVVQIADVVGDYIGPAGGRGEAVDVGWQFALSFDALIAVRNAERRISEPDCVVTLVATD